LWFEIICLAHEAEPYGYLTIAGRPMTDVELARAIGETPAAVRRLLLELESAGVPSRTPEGSLYSRRMVKDERLRELRAAGGIHGAPHGIKGKEFGARGGRPKTPHAGAENEAVEPPLKPPLRPPIKPPPSSSSSYSEDQKLESGTDPGYPEQPPLPGDLTRATWAAWVKHLSEKGKPMSAMQERMILSRLPGMFPSGIEAVVMHSLTSGWKSLHAPDVKRQTQAERRAAANAAMVEGLNHEPDEPTDITAEVVRIA
jgi:hypothetical protein